LFLISFSLTFTPRRPPKPPPHPPPPTPHPMERSPSFLVTVLCRSWAPSVDLSIEFETLTTHVRSPSLSSANYFSFPPVQSIDCLSFPLFSTRPFPLILRYSLVIIHTVFFFVSIRFISSLIFGGILSVPGRWAGVFPAGP